MEDLVVLPHLSFRCHATVADDLGKLKDVLTLNPLKLFSKNKILVEDCIFVNCASRTACKNKN